MPLGAQSTDPVAVDVRLLECYHRTGNLDVSIPGSKFIGLANRGTGEKMKLRSDNHEQEDIDSAGEIEGRDPEKCGRRWDMVVIDYQPSCHR